PLDEPRRRAVGEALELRHAERDALRELVDDERMPEPRRPYECLPCPDEPTLPPVCACERRGCLRVVRVQAGEATHPLALRRRGLELPRELRERPADRRPRDLVGREDGADLVPERARLARRALV